MFLGDLIGSLEYVPSSKTARLIACSHNGGCQYSFYSKLSKDCYLLS
jgi:hypothetical protein